MTKVSTRVTYIVGNLQEDLLALLHSPKPKTMHPTLRIELENKQKKSSVAISWVFLLTMSILMSKHTWKFDALKLPRYSSSLVEVTSIRKSRLPTAHSDG